MINLNVIDTIIVTHRFSIIAHYSAKGISTISHFMGPNFITDLLFLFAFCKKITALPTGKASTSAVPNELCFLIVKFVGVTAASVPSAVTVNSPPVVPIINVLCAFKYLTLSSFI